jgi:hypothetical protein
MLLIVSDRVTLILSASKVQMMFCGPAEFCKMAAERGKTRGQDVEDILKCLHLINLIK